MNQKKRTDEKEKRVKHFLEMYRKDASRAMSFKLIDTIIPLLDTTEKYSIWVSMNDLEKLTMTKAFSDDEVKGLINGQVYLPIFDQYGIYNEEIKNFFDNNQKLKACKLIKKLNGIGLKDAKVITDKLWDLHGIR